MNDSSYVLFIKAENPLASNASTQKWRTSPWVVAWRLIAPLGEILDKSEDNELAFHKGPQLRAIVERTAKVMNKLPQGIQFEVVSDFDSFWKAFPPNENWLIRWKPFHNKPKHDRDAWKELSDTAEERRIVISSPDCAVLSLKSQEILGDLLTELRGRLEIPDENDVEY